ncbi:hypothetical protein PUND_a2303 [Pseudoalteromonas undina]|nr:hypothetical protein PUND_a2303 [Pseudoalteromonas undina]
MGVLLFTTFLKYFFRVSRKPQKIKYNQHYQTLEQLLVD